METQEKSTPLFSMNDYVVLEIHDLIEFEIRTVLIIPREDLARMKMRLTKPLPSDRLWISHF